MVSVIVPVYNRAESLSRCVDSILSQSYSHIELLLVDDGSKDDSGLICDGYAQKDPRVKVFHKPNGGASSARNMGLDNAVGDWVSFVDSDDYLNSDFLEILMSGPEADMAIGSCRSMINGRLSRIWRIPDVQIDCMASMPEFFANNLTSLLMQSACVKLYRKSLFDDGTVRFNPEISLGEDQLFGLILYNRIDSVKVNGRAVYNYMLSYNFSERYAMSLDKVNHMLYLLMTEVVNLEKTYGIDLSDYKRSVVTGWLCDSVRLEDMFDKQTDRQRREIYSSYIPCEELDHNPSMLCLRRMKNHCRNGNHKEALRLSKLFTDNAGQTIKQRNDLYISDKLLLCFYLEKFPQLFHVMAFLLGKVNAFRLIIKRNKLFK